MIVAGVSAPSRQENAPDSTDVSTPTSGVIAPVVIIASGSTPSPMPGELRSHASPTEPT